MHTHVQILYKIGLTAYLSISLSCSFLLSWFPSKASLLYLHHQLLTLCSPTKDLSKWVSTRHSSLRVPALSGLYSRYLVVLLTCWHRKQPNHQLLLAALLLRDQVPIAHLYDHQRTMESSNTHRGPMADLGNQRVHGLDDQGWGQLWEVEPPWIPICGPDLHQASEPIGLPSSALNMLCHLDGRKSWGGRPWALVHTKMNAHHPSMLPWQYPHMWS